MAGRIFRKPEGLLESRVVFLMGSIPIGSDASVTTATTIAGATVTKTATGAYTITFADPYASALCCVATLQAATAVDLVPQVVSFDPTNTTKTVVIKLLAGATATDPSAACRLNVFIALKNSEVSGA